MKKVISFLITILFLFSITACGDMPPAPSGAASGSESSLQANVTDNRQLPSAGQTQVKTEENKVITTLNDGLGTLTTTEYIYKNGALDEITLTMQFSGVAEAKAVYESMKSGELKSTADAAYVSFILDGKKIVCKMNDGMKAVFSGFSQSELAATLCGDVPAESQQSGNADMETTVNTKWEDISLPSEFPKLSEGVTGYTQISAESFSFDWDILPRTAADKMIKQLEAWTGTTAEKSEMDGSAFWIISNDRISITVNYYNDTFGGAMSQCIISVIFFD